MAKSEKSVQQEVIGWYQPHVAVDWTGEILNEATGELVKEPSMTKQSFKDECDINNIVRRFEATGILDHVNKASAQGLYVDLPDGLDLQLALNTVAQAEAAFMALPAAARAEYGNDPVAFVAAFNDPTPDQVKRFVELGLAVTSRPAQDPLPAPSPVPAPADGGTGGTPGKAPA